ncbi:MAG: hypothetical protein AB7K09_23130, partial [Planctomycetota bacterium]
MANVLTRIGSGIARAFRAMAPKRPMGLQRLNSQLLQLARDPDRLTADVTKLLPRLSDMIFGLIRDPDELLEKDEDAYDLIFDDDQISASIDNLLLPVAEASWQFHADRADSEKLIEPLKELCLNVFDWDQLVLDLSYALITGMRIIRPVYETRQIYGYDALKPKKFVFKDKRRFRAADPDWEEMYLIDDGFHSTQFTSVGMLTMQPKALNRSWFIIARWRNTEERFGYGKGIGSRLYRLKKVRGPLLKILFEMLETTAGGIRMARPSLEALKGMTKAEQQEWMNTVRDALDNAISADTLVMPPGVEEVNMWFPPDSVGSVILQVVDSYIDQQISKVLSGVTLTEEAQQVGSHSLGKVHSKSAHRRMQLIANWGAGVLNRDYVPAVALYNPWIYEYAGVPRNTPLPQLKAHVSGSDDLTQVAGVANQIRVPVFKNEYLRNVGGGMFRLATDADVESGAAFIPGESGPQAPGAGGGMRPSEDPNDPLHGLFSGSLFGENKQQGSIKDERKRRGNPWRELAPALTLEDVSELLDEKLNRLIGKRDDRRPDGTFAPKGSGDQTGQGGDSSPEESGAVVEDADFSRPGTFSPGKFPIKQRIANALEDLGSKLKAFAKDPKKEGKKTIDELKQSAIKMANDMQKEFEEAGLSEKEAKEFALVIAGSLVSPDGTGTVLAPA